MISWYVDTESGVSSSNSGKLNANKSYQRCPKEWAKDTNKLVCQYAIPHEFNECSHHHPEDCDQLGKEDDYYEKAKPIIQQQIAKG